MNDLVLIDGNSLLFRAYYATAATGNFMFNKDGIPTNAIFGFARMMNTILKRHPRYLIVAFDVGRTTFRNELMENYKATRKPAPEELIPQFEIVREYLRSANITYYELEGYEGDDLIGTLSRFGEDHDLNVSIYTGDKDAFQLISDKTTIYRTNKRGVSEMEIVGLKELEERYDLKPDQIRDLLGLMGDTADNIPGIKGVGEKTALKLLHEYGSVEGIQEHQNEIKGKMGEKVRAGMNDAIASKQIATILRDVPIDVDLDKAAYDGYDFETLKAFYAKYDMNSLIRSMTIEQGDQIVETNEETVLDQKPVVANVVKSFPDIKEDTAVYAVIYDENYHKSFILGYGFYNPNQSFYIDLTDALSDDNFKSYMKDETKHKYGFDIKAAIIGSRWNGVDLKGMVFDLRLASYVLSPSIKDEVKDTCNYFNYEQVHYDEQVFGKGAKRHIPDVEMVAVHAQEKAKAIYVLKNEAIKKLKEENQYELYQSIELPVAHILGEMEWQGAKVNPDVLERMETVFEKQIEETADKIYYYAGEVFNIGSPKQLGDILFNKMGFKAKKKTKTGYSTAQPVLESMVDQHPIFPLLLDYRMLTKLSSTYLKGLQSQIFSDGKIHTIYLQTLTQTGRLSSIDPNLQNIPVRTEEGKKIRYAFEPSFDYLVSFDYSQIELRILAHVAKVKGLIDAFNADKDIHRHTAALVFGLDDSEVTDEMRRQAKAVNFGIIYGMSNFRLANDVGMSMAEATRFIERYYQTYPEIAVYMNDIVESCSEKGYVSTVLNRKRYIPTINDRNRTVREQAKRFAMNAPIQGSGADIMKLSMIKVDEVMKKHHFKSKMILQVHDELIFDVAADELDELMTVVKKAMEDCFKMDVPLKVDGNYGKTWGDLK
ncbi:MAG: DNA polymerase I [Erysipelotrichaceae bacterium]|nr:DNA polymerase I [Erysipelotrichaceae bacterium]